MEDINKQAELYAESFRYKVDDGSWYEQKKRDFIAGYEAALRIHDVVGQSEQLPDDEEETKCPDHTPYWGVCSTCGQY